MSYTIKHRQEPNYFRITLFGRTDEQALLNLTSDVILLLTMEKPNKVLIDRSRLEGNLSLFGALDSVKAFPEGLKNIKAAVLDKPENAEPDRDYEMFATNHGFRLKFFTRKSDAELWLHAPDN